MTTVGVYNKARAIKRIRRDPKRRGVYKGSCDMSVMYVNERKLSHAIMIRYRK